MGGLTLQVLSVCGGVLLFGRVKLWIVYWCCWDLFNLNNSLTDGNTGRLLAGLGFGVFGIPLHLLTPPECNVPLTSWLSVF